MIVVYDILLIAGIAAFLIYRLFSVLGTRHGEERERPNPFSSEPVQKRALQDTPAAPLSPSSQQTVIPLAGMEQLVDDKANADGRIAEGLNDIAAADRNFQIGSFMQGARMAFEMIVMAYSRGDLDTLRGLLSPKLYSDFEAGVKAREAAGHSNELTIHRIKSARIVEAHLGGTMAYVTVDFDVEETSVTRDASGNVVEGDPDKIFRVEDVWTFTRDVRSSDPNWILIETRAAEE
jgi:predicted lipid-binding transport protein (Tim44 family)